MLRAIAERAHQVAQLALAADHNRDASQPRRWNHHAVGIKIERMRNHNSTSAQITPQGEPRTLGTNPEQASSRRELDDPVKAVGKRSPIAQTTKPKLQSVRFQRRRQGGELTFASTCLQRIR